MVRIVAVADTHLFHHELDVPDGDVFVHAGTSVAVVSSTSCARPPNGSRAYRIGTR